MVELCVLIDIVLPRDGLPVVSDFGAVSKLVAPVGLWRKGRLIDVRWNITANPFKILVSFLFFLLEDYSSGVLALPCRTWIYVLVPSSTLNHVRRV